MATRRRFLAGAAAAVAASRFVNPQALHAAPAAGTEDRPNILIFMPDQTQGQTVLPGSPCLTPNIDRFAAQGVLFKSSYCPYPHCCPSRASFQTGLYPSEHGVFNNVDTDTSIHSNPYPGTKYFAEYLRRAGYQLDYSGKWHVARDITPQDAGWTNAYLKSGSAPAYWPNQFVPGTTRKDGHGTKARAEIADRGPRQPGEILRPGWGNTQLYKTLDTANADGFVVRGGDYRAVHTGAEKMKRLAGMGKPWALMVSNSGAHDPYDAPRKFVDMYDPKSIELPFNFRDTMMDKPRIYQRMRYQYWDQMSDDEVKQAIRHYWARVTMQDALFGRLLDALEQTGQADNTLVLLVADHGDYAAAHGLYAKGIPSFREAYNIPTIIRWPRGIVNPGRQVEALVSTTDFAPTFLEAAGVPSSDYAMSGQSLLPWLKNETPATWREALFTQMNGVELYYSQRIVMTKDYKYVYNGFDFDELYDLRQDPHETRNLAFPDVSQSRSVIQQRGVMNDATDVPWPPLPAHLAEVRRDLLQRMWQFAQEHKDTIFNPYLTVAMAPYGPGIKL
ncbi:MAG TPA: sulfatase-like hydrolase/transferase [Terriglobales bacterium]|nr:sulfatase-like hydrolase/transferase [Terriglobales bacterium]